MTTLGDLIDQVIDQLHGHSTDLPAMASLVGAITPESDEIALDFGIVPWAGRPNGVVEIGDELLAVASYNAGTGVASVPAWGRGFRGTVAQSHAEGSLVTVRPRYPRKHVARVINQVVKGSCPPLYAARDLAAFETGAFVGLGYALPSDTLRVLRVDATETNLPDELNFRRVVRDWSVRNVAGTQMLQLDRGDVYETIQVTIAAIPGEMTTESADFTTATGLDESCVDMVMFGAISRLVLGAELAKQQVTSVEAQMRNDKVQSGSATTISRYYQALYTQRLEAERDRLAQLYPVHLMRRS